MASLDVEIQNNTFCIDTGCVYGRALSAYRYPENEIVQVRTKKVWSDVDHITNMETIKKYVTQNDKLFMATNYIVVNLKDKNSIEKGINWWKILLKMVEKEW